MDAIMGQLDSYFAALKSRGEGVPRFRDTDWPLYGAIAAALGVEKKVLKCPRYEKRIARAIREIGLGGTQRTKRFVEQEKLGRNAALLGAYLVRLAEAGQKLPEDPSRPGEIYYEQIQAEAGMTYGALHSFYYVGDERESRLRDMVTREAPRLGVGVRLLQMPFERPLRNITYEFLLERGAEERKAELKGAPRAAQQLYNTRSALRRFCKLRGLDEAALVADEMAAGFRKALAESAPKIQKSSGRKKFRTEMRRWHVYYLRLLNEPTSGTFRELLVRLIDGTGLPPSIVAKLAGVDPKQILSWYNGDCKPNGLSLEPLSKIEGLFQIPSGSLSGKLEGVRRRIRFRASQLPQCLREDKKLRSRITRYLKDDFLSETPERQVEIVEGIKSTILESSGDPYTTKLRELRGLPYLLKKNTWPTQALKEVESLIKFKTDEGSPVGMHRKGRWRASTAKKMKHHLSSLLGALRLPRDAEDPRLRGLGVPDEDLSVALLACPEVGHWYIKFYCERRNQYTTFSVALVEFFMNLLEPHYGWLRQSPRLAKRLTVVADDGDGTRVLVSRRLTAEARSNWNKVCDKAWAYYERLSKELKILAKPARDPFHRIEGIIELEKPMTAMATLADGMKRDMPDRDESSVYYHIAVRDYVITLFFNLTGIRPTTVSLLDCTGDRRGHLTFEEGSYRLEISRFLFKDPESSYFGTGKNKEDYLSVIPDLHDFNAMMTEYVTVSRPFLLERYHPDCKENPLFVATISSRSARLGPVNLSKLYFNKTSLHLAENEWRGTGIAGVKGHGAQAVRHQRGTAFVRETGSLQYSADGNQNTLRTASRHYTKHMPKNRNALANKILVERLI